MNQAPDGDPLEDAGGRSAEEAFEWETQTAEFAVDYMKLMLDCSPLQVGQRRGRPSSPSYRCVARAIP